MVGRRRTPAPRTAPSHRAPPTVAGTAEPSICPNAQHRVLWMMTTTALQLSAPSLLSGVRGSWWVGCVHVLHAHAKCVLLVIYRNIFIV